MPKLIDHSPRLKEFDKSLLKEGERLICGVDEVGRGPLAGPVVTAAVVFDIDTIIPYVNDSKKLSEKRREALFEEITRGCVAYSIGSVDHQMIDEINILYATKLAMNEAIKNLTAKPDIILIDAVKLEDIHIRTQSVIKGDAKSFAIAAASIVAKVTRDRLMEEYDSIYPGYSFGSHKGYGTKAHYEAIERLGLCPIHRRSFLKKLS